MFMQETMKIMGLKLWLSWIAWFIKYFMFIMISVILMTFFLHLHVGNGAVINYSSFGVTLVFLTLYACATIMFCFMISTFVSKGMCHKSSQVY
jgi:ATP-binding cassette subfamily A (ABC1) protein 3